MSVAGAEHAQRTARARAVAASITDAPRVPRRFHVPERTVLRPTKRKRVSQPLPRVQVGELFKATRSRRRTALVILLVQLVALGALLVAPTFHVSTIAISGARLMSRDAIVSAADIGSSQSIFTVDGQAVRHRLEHLPWVRSASVETELPGTVRISITEWTPVLRVHDARGDRLVAPGGESLDTAATAGLTLPALALLTDERPFTDGRQPALDPTLMRTLVAVEQAFPSTFGVKVARFDWQPDGRLAIVAATGWRAILGNVANDADVAAIPGQLNALAALKPKLNLLVPTFGYIDLANTSAPAVGGKPGQPDVVPSVPATGSTSTATPSPTPSPTPKPSPTPTPPPTPAHFTVGGPTPPPQGH
jgi:cell division septal protein FtsQ